MNKRTNQQKCRQNTTLIFNKYYGNNNCLASCTWIKPYNESAQRNCVVYLFIFAWWLDSNRASALEKSRQIAEKYRGADCNTLTVCFPVEFVYAVRITYTNWAGVLTVTFFFHLYIWICRIAVCFSLHFYFVFVIFLFASLFLIFLIAYAFDLVLLSQVIHAQKYRRTTLLSPSYFIHLAQQLSYFFFDQHSFTGAYILWSDCWPITLQCQAIF